MRTLAIDPANLFTNLFGPMISLYRGHFAEMAVRIKRAADVVGPDPMLDSYQALALAKQGHAKKSLKMLQKSLRGRTRLHTHHAMHMSAAAYAVLGDKARAVRLLAKAAATGFPDYPAFRDDPHFASLHRYGPFLKLMAALRKECAGYQREFGSAPVNPSPASPIQAQ
jgi:hypothetical protein